MCMKICFLQVIISGSNTAYAGLTTGETTCWRNALVVSCADCVSLGDILFWDRDGGGILHRLQVTYTLIQSILH